MDLSKPKILIVDDERFFINILVNLLNTEYRTVIALNGEEAIERTLTDSPPDLILLDIVMPGMDGYEVCKRLKQNAKSRDIPIIFLTVRSEVDDETKGFQLGAIDYITKPISPPIVKARVSTHLILEQTREELKNYNRELEDTVAERTKDLTQEILDRKNTEAQLYHLANYDSLTTLPNSILFRQQLAQLIKNANTQNLNVGLLLLDLVDFKHVNKILGYSNGDALLKQVADLLSDTVPDADSIARIGADKFAIALLENKRSNQIKRICSKIESAFKRPFRLETSDYFANFRMGVSKFPATSAKTDSLLTNAEFALTQAKSGLDKDIVHYAPLMNKRVRERRSLSKGLASAIKRKQLRLFFQPIFESASLNLVAAEALVRWQHPKRGLLMPSEFIPIAENSDTILKLGEWILNSACVAARRWSEISDQKTKVAVNMASRQCYYNLHCLSTIAKILKDTRLEADNLSLEVSESVFVDAPEQSLDKLIAVKELGVEIALSHFGIGYSSMGLIRNKAIDRIKIDRSVVADLQENNTDLSVLTAILAMSDALGLRVTAEGVESQSQLDILKSAGCEWVQGFFTGKPMPADQFEKYIENYRPGSS